MFSRQIQLEKLVFRIIAPAALSLQLIASAPVQTMAAVEPAIVQGAIDLQGVAKQPGSSLLIQIFAAESSNNLPLAGAKVKMETIDEERFIFQLYKENLLTSESNWKSLGDFNQLVAVKICGEIDRMDCTSGSTIAKGQAIAKLVTIPRQPEQKESTARTVRLLPLVKLIAN